MQLFRILTLAGASSALIIIVFGIVAVCSPSWIVLTASQQLEATYDLFERCNKPLIDVLEPLAGCEILTNLQTAQGLIISGLITVGIGIIVSSPLVVLLENTSWIKSVPQVLLIIGPTLILIGLLFYVKNALGQFIEGTSTLELGYSFILIVVTCIIGYISAAYFLFATGFVQGYDRGRSAISLEAAGDQ